MAKGFMIGLIALLSLNIGLVGCSKSAVEKRSASPTMGERLKKDAVTGKVHDIGSRHVSIRDTNGETQRVRVDDQTKMDQVAVGDQVKAYVSEDGYASTIQRVAP